MGWPTPLTSGGMALILGGSASIGDTSLPGGFGATYRPGELVLTRFFCEGLI